MFFLLQLLHFKLVSIFVSSVSILVPICIAGNCTIITWFNAASLHIFDALLYTCFGCRAVCSPLKPVYRYDDNRYICRAFYSFWLHVLLCTQAVCPLEFEVYWIYIYIYIIGNSTHVERCVRFFCNAWLCMQAVCPLLFDVYVYIYR